MAEKLGLEPVPVIDLPEGVEPADEPGPAN
jgi:hypothetical protein